MAFPVTHMITASNGFLIYSKADEDGDTGGVVFFIQCYLKLLV